MTQHRRQRNAQCVKITLALAILNGAGQLSSASLAFKVTSGEDYEGRVLETWGHTLRDVRDQALGKHLQVTRHRRKELNISKSYIMFSDEAAAKIKHSSIDLEDRFETCNARKRGQIRMVPLEYLANGTSACAYTQDWMDLLSVLGLSKPRRWLATELNSRYAARRMKKSKAHFEIIASFALRRRL